MTWRSLYNVMTLCQFRNPGVARVLDALSVITGSDLDAGDVMRIGKRILVLKRLINLRRGLTPEDEHLAELLTRALDGPTEGFVPDQEALLADAELRWDPVAGRPTPATLADLGLDQIR